MDNNETVGIILMSHGRMAEGILDGVSMIYGRPDNVVVLELQEGMEPSDYADMLDIQMRQFPQGALLLVDLFGGTPCNVAMMHARKLGRVLPVAAGLNMPMLLGVLNARENMPLDELVAEAISASEKGTVDVSEKQREIFESIEKP